MKKKPCLTRFEEYFKKFTETDCVFELTWVGLEEFPGPCQQAEPSEPSEVPELELEKLDRVETERV